MVGGENSLHPVQRYLHFSLESHQCSQLKEDCTSKLSENYLYVHICYLSLKSINQRPLFFLFKANLLQTCYFFCLLQEPELSGAWLLHLTPQLRPSLWRIYFLSYISTVNKEAWLEQWLDPPLNLPTHFANKILTPSPPHPRATISSLPALSDNS